MDAVPKKNRRKSRDRRTGKDRRQYSPPPFTMPLKGEDLNKGESKSIVGSWTCMSRNCRKAGNFLVQRYLLKPGLLKGELCIPNLNSVNREIMRVGVSCF